MGKNKIITVQDIPVTVSFEDAADYICITDMAAAKSDNSRAADVIRNCFCYKPDFQVILNQRVSEIKGRRK